MTTRRSGSAISPEFRAEMDRVGLGALEVISRHKKSTPPGEPQPSLTRTLPGRAADHAPPTVPGRGRRKITPETRFRAAQGRTRLTSGSARAKAMELLTVGDKLPATVNLADLRGVLGQDARGVVGKLIEAGWLEIVS